MIAYFLSKLIIIFYGMLYPAYCSYKAVKTKDVKEYVNWMMYWITFSIFNIFEVFADTFIGLWFPFYYELKILFMIWLLSPTTRGSSTMYRRFIHPFFARHEGEIDGYLAELKVRASSLIFQWGSKAFNYVTELVMSAVVRGAQGDFKFMNKVTRTCSYENFDQPDINRNTNAYPQVGMDSHGDDLISSDMDSSFNSFDEPRAPRRQRNPNVRYVSIDGQLGDLSNRPFSMIDLTDQTQQQPPKVRNTRKKKEFGNYSMVTGGLVKERPMVFGWYPPDMSSPIMSTPYSVQEFSRLPFSFPAGTSTSGIFPSTTTNLLLENQAMSFYEIQSFDHDSDHESDKFFDCSTDSSSKETIDEEDVDCSPVTPKVQVVSKTVLKGFDGESVSVTLRNKGGQLGQQQSESAKRSSVTSLQSLESSKYKSVKKSLSNSELKLVKAPVISTSSFSRVFSPFSSSVSKKSSSPTSSGKTTKIKETK